MELFVSSNDILLEKAQQYSRVFLGFSLVGKTNEKSKIKPFKVPSKFNFRSYEMLLHETFGAVVPTGKVLIEKKIYIIIKSIHSFVFANV